MSNDTIRIPVSATYRVINGNAEMIDAEYWDVSVDALARFFMDAFNVPVTEPSV